jgi:hypothetical protein
MVTNSNKISTLDLRIVQIGKTLDVQKLSIKFLQDNELINCGLIIKSNFSSQKRDIMAGTNLGRVIAIEKSTRRSTILISQ